MKPAAKIHPMLVLAAVLATMFCAVQAVELAAGAVNITLLGLNMRDGLKMKGWLRRVLT